MSRKNSIKIVLAAFAGASLLAACSQHEVEVSLQKSDIDHQKDIQMQMVDNKAQELKHNVETNRKLALQKIAEQKKALAAQMQALDAEKAKIDASAEYADQNLRDQAAACKTKIKLNVQKAKGQIEEAAREADLH